MQIDHILIPVTDLDNAAHELETRFGLTSVEGGRHPGWGTANRIVPLGAAYLELIAVVDAAMARGSAFGRWMADAATDPPRPAGWAVRVADIRATARRLGLPVAAGSRLRPDGRMVGWHTVGLEAAVAEPWLPFFIHWSDEADLPGLTAVAHPAGSVRLSRVEICGDPSRLAAWLGDHAVPIDIRPGDPGVRAVLERQADEETGPAGPIRLG